jgi:hypothetical protein
LRVPPTLLGNLHAITDVLRWISRLALAINGNLNFGSTMSNTDADINMNVWKAFGTTPAAPNTDFTITHSLSDGNGLHRVPITIVGQDTNNGGLLYRGSVPWSKTTITLRCTTASAVYNVIVS